MQDKIKNIKNMVTKEKVFFKEALLNMFAFAIYIFSQQIILLPVCAKILDSQSYANMIICVTMMNLFCNVLGGQLGITHQLRLVAYDGNKQSELNDFFILMVMASLVIGLLFPFVLVGMHLSLLDRIIFAIVVLLSNFRLYIRYYFRITSEYGQTVIQNVFYLVGIIIGVFVYSYIPHIWVPLLCAEVCSVLYILVKIPKKSVKLARSAFFPETIKQYAGLGSIDILTNLTTLVDKLLVYPLLGAYSLGVYNAGSTVSKVSALIMNPLNEVVLVRLSKAKELGLKSLLKNIILISLLVITVLFVLFVPVIYILSAFLYSQFLSDILTIIICLSLISAIDTTSSVMKSFILRFAKPSQLTLCYFINLIFITVGGIIGAKYFGLVGFAVSIVITQVERWVSFVIMLIRICKKESEMEFLNCLQ